MSEDSHELYTISVYHRYDTYSCIYICFRICSSLWRDTHTISQMFIDVLSIFTDVHRLSSSFIVLIDVNGFPLISIDIHQVY